MSDPFRIPPSAVDAEAAVLGACLLGADALATVLGFLDPEHFFLPKHALIYAAMYRLARQGEPVDIATVSSELEKTGELEKCGGSSALIDIADSVWTTANAEAHAKIILDKWALRKVSEQGQQLIGACQDHPGPAGELIAEFQRRLSIVGAGLTPGRGRYLAASVCLGDVAAEEVEWLWEPYLPVGALTILEGDPGVGKTFLALQLIAILSQGWVFPDYRTGKPAQARSPLPSIYLTAEDGLGNTLRPRLDKAGADCRLVHAITGIKGQAGIPLPERQITLRDIPELEAEVERIRPALVVVDPLQAYIGADVDLSKSNETRPVLSGLAMLAERQRVSILLIRHLTKGGAGKAIYRGLGGMDLLGAARSVLLAGEDPQNPKQRVIAQIKMNLAERGASIGYTLDTDGFHWTGLSRVTAEDMNAAGFRPGGGGEAVDTAADWLQEMLAGHSVAANEIQAQAHRQGIRDHPLKAAKRLLGVVSVKAGTGWMWQLPAEQV